MRGISSKLSPIGGSLKQNNKGLVMKIYTAQINSFGNVIVCGDDIPRNSYKIIFKGSYKDCLKLK
jgi:hypothetical protein